MTSLWKNCFKTKPNSFNFADLKASNEDLEEENHEKDESQENRKYSEPSEEIG